MTDLYNRRGDKYSTDDPTEIVRLRAYGYTVDSPEFPPTVTEQQFHPGDHPVPEVLTYLAEHPEDVERIRAEEKALPRPRTSILGETADTDG